MLMWLWIGAIVVATYVLSSILPGITKTYRNRQRLLRLPTLGPYHPLWGSVQITREMQKDIPSDLHPHAYPIILMRKYNIKSKLAYFDTSPLGRPIVFVLDPDLVNQVLNVHSLPKAIALKNYIQPLLGSGSLLITEGAEWKKMRNLFNSGFSIGHLMTLTSLIVEETSVFLDILIKKAETGELVEVEELATKLAIDIIARITLPIKFDSQTSENEFVNTFRAQARDLPAMDGMSPIDHMNPFRPRRQRKRTAQMDQYLGRVLDEYYDQRLLTEKRIGNPGGGEKKLRRVVDLALDLYEKEFSHSSTSNRVLDPAFRRLAIDQVKTFLAAGHDTTATTISYALYLLHENPQTAVKLIDELNTVLGNTNAEAISSINDDPHVLNKLVYTNGVIKETLRLFPPVNSLRTAKGLPNFKITDPITGEKWPTWNYIVWPPAYSVHRNEEQFPRPEEFVPERFVPELSPYAQPHRDAWIPFSKGPRNCIGQELAMMELRIILALTVREVDFVAEYTLPPNARLENHSFGGHMPYNILAGAAKPKNHMPGRLYFREKRS